MGRRDFVKRALKLTAALVVIAFLVFGIPKIKKWVEIDSCLDHGGSWNYQENKAEYGTQQIIERKSTEKEKALTSSARPMDVNDNVQWQDGRKDEVTKIISEKFSYADTETPGKNAPIADKQAAVEYLTHSVNMARGPSLAVEIADYYVFSGGTSTKNITDFSSGIAIRKSDGKIFIWQSK